MKIQVTLTINLDITYTAWNIYLQYIQEASMKYIVGIFPSSL